MAERIARDAVVAVVGGLVVRLLAFIRPALLQAVAALGVVLVSAVSVEAMPLRTKVALGCFAVGSYWDAVNTAYWVARGEAHETNPLYRPIVRRYGIAVTMTVKGSGNSALGGAIIADDRRGHERRAFWSAVGVCAGQTAVNIGNARRVKGDR